MTTGAPVACGELGAGARIAQFAPLEPGSSNTRSLYRAADVLGLAVMVACDPLTIGRV